MRIPGILGGVLFFGGLLASCGGDGGGGGVTQMASLAGTVKDPNGAGIPGVGVSVSGPTTLVTVSTVTDANGNFIVLDPPLGMDEVHFDGSTATVPGTFAPLGIPITIGTGENNLPQAIVLPDLDQGATAAVSVDAAGMTTADTDVMFDMETVLNIPTGVTILLDGAPAVGSVDVNMTPVPPENVPMPLPGALNPSSFVTIQPANASFNPALSITLPNSDDLPVGTMVDIWSFDHGEGTWVNRSEETGNQGVVTDLGGFLAIVADNVITEGGWHSGTTPVDPECATTIAGRVVDLSDNPVPDVLVSLSTGQFGSTLDDGTFSIPNVPAYDASLLPEICMAVDVEIHYLAPVAFGAVAHQDLIAAGTIVTGGITDLGDVPLAVVEKGSLVGLVSENGAGLPGTVRITGPAPLTDVQEVQSSAQGTFFVACLEPGDYTAEFDFDSGTATVDLTVTAHRTTVINVIPEPASGSQVNVLVVAFGEGNTEEVPIPGARVTLQTSSQSGLGLTNAQGIASFNGFTGPFTVTAQMETNVGGFMQRLAMSLVGVNPPGTPVTIGVPFFEGAPANVALDATLMGTVTNIPTGGIPMVEVSSNQVPGGFLGFAFPDGTGAYSLGIPSGVQLDASALAPGGTLGAVIETGISAGAGQTITRDFNFNGTSFCPFDNAVNVTYTNPPTGADVFGFAGLVLRGAGDLFFPAIDTTSMGSPPATIMLPDLSDAKISGLAKILEIGAEIDDPVNFDTNVIVCDTILGTSTPTALQVTFVGSPTVVQPPNMATLNCSQPDCLDLEGEIFSFTLGSAHPTLSEGYNVVDIDGDGPGGLTTQWDIWLPSTFTSVGLPKISPDMPMFFSGEYDLDVEVTRFDSPGFNFVTFFDANVAQKIRDLKDTSPFCSTETDSIFSVGAPALVTRDLPESRRLSRHLAFLAAVQKARERAGLAGAPLGARK